MSRAARGPDGARSRGLGAQPPLMVIELVDAVAVFGGFPALAGASLTSTAARSCGCAARTAPARPRCCVCAPGWCRSHAGTGRCSGATSPPTATRSAPWSASSATTTVSTSTSRFGRTSPSGPRAVGASAAEVDAALERLGLAGRLEVLAVRRLSAGQQRRTALACLVARRAELWLLDEPHSSLDADGRADLDAIVRQAAASGATVIIASHEYDRARPLATRVVEVTGGLVVEEPA